MIDKIKYDAVFTHEVNNKYYWTLILNVQAFDYSQGAAYFTPYHPHTYRSGNFNKRNKKPDNGLANSNLGGWLHVPTLNDALYCLLLDMTSGEETFQDFCDNCGYDSDSITAFKVYTACQDNATKLRKALTSEQIKHWQIELEEY